MRPLPLTGLCLLSAIAIGYAQPAPVSFDVASVRPSRHKAGPDYNNKVTYSPGEFNGQNVTLKRLVAEAWYCQLNQVVGPAWIDRNEYDITTRMPGSASN